MVLREIDSKAVLQARQTDTYANEQVAEERSKERQCDGAPHGDGQIELVVRIVLEKELHTGAQFAH